ncbi:MAG: 4-alpha-glucanotransferase [Geobacter sp.]|nr:4-alpha-glucanotransferase [Geobacter sp.]
MNIQRKSGILLHPTSLPGHGGIGTFGGEARQFVDFLQAAGQVLWQVLPLGPPGYGNSPYSCYSAFAGNPLLIDLATVVSEGDLRNDEISPVVAEERIDFTGVAAYKLRLLRQAADRFFAGNDPRRTHSFWHFCDTSFWLHDYALFMALKDLFKGKCWNRWPKELVLRNRDECAEYSHRLGHEVGFHKYMQWQFHRQWKAVKQYANERNILIVGDTPIFVAYDSVDVWCNQHLFKLDSHRLPELVAGVPPDYFSKTGQRWGNPVYDWERLAADGFGWWIARLKNDLSLYDVVRLDHFRGFEAYWEIPAKEKTAIKGQWVKGPGEALFSSFQAAVGKLPFIAEDLGLITPEVLSLRDRFGLPGMKVLQFAFEGGARNGYLPHNYVPNCVVYTGTHDNDTTQGWFDTLNGEQQRRVCRYLRCTPEEVVWEMIRLALSSVAATAIIPLQDILGLSGSARMNTPGTVGENWRWRFSSHDLTADSAIRLRELTEFYARYP